MGVSERTEYSMGMRVTVIMVVVFVGMVMIGSVVVRSGAVVVVGMIVFAVVRLVYRLGFLAVCRLGRVKHACGHGNRGERSGCVSVTDPSPSYPNREVVVGCG